MKISNARLSFPNIFKPTAFAEGQDKKYSATFILPSYDPQVKQIKEEMRRIAKEKWGDDVPSNIKLCLRDGSEKEMDGFGSSTVFFNASNSKRPGVFDRDRTPLVAEDGRPYAGCYVNAVVEFWAQDNKYGKRINASLSGLQFSKDGDSFGGGARSANADDFDDVSDDGDDDDFL